MFEPDDYEELVTFLYQIPFGVARMSADGELGMANPRTVQLMLQMKTGVTNLFEALDAYAPDVRTSVEGFEANHGVVVRERRVDFGIRDPRRSKPLVVVVTITKLNTGRFMVVLRDESESIERAA